MSPSLIKSLMQGMNDMYFAMEAENRALRELLRRQGLSNATIRRRVAAYLKEEDYGNPHCNGCTNYAKKR